jgi:glycosyltransferase involved in cell wall biosynthesis
VKGHDILLRALALLRDRGIAFTCTLAGDGPQRDEIAARIDALGLAPQVCLVGIVPHGELLARLARGEYDVSVLASVERDGGLMEGVPVALTEAMAAGTVVVASDSGSIGELVDATTGVLVPHSDPGALADGLARIAADPALCERLREAARERVAREYDVRNTTIRFCSLLSSTMSAAESREIAVRDAGYSERAPAGGGAH